ncbi:MAG: glycosyl hydrolase repeat-containing protein, partial [Firmicutes bacterium]|nr:glycosyl hydrolase repeat-containing protein [Bacillota bacterium]
SPDLTRNDKSKLGPAGGPISYDQTSVEYYCTIFAFAESPATRGVLWAGSDDGLVHVSRDNGTSWQNVTPKDLPEWAMISIIDPSHHDPGTAYVAATRYKLDDYRPYLYKTTDYGESWTKITEGIPENSFTRVVRADPASKGLLFAGTETGLYVSFDDGAQWQPLQQNLPVCPVHDLVIKHDDLVVGTHGRSFWILDGGVAVLRQITDQVGGADAHLFTTPVTYRVKGAFRTFFKDQGTTVYNRLGTVNVTGTRKPDGTLELLDAGMNPPIGVAVTYFLKSKPEGEVKLRFLDAKGQLIKEFTSKEAEAPKSGGQGHDSGHGKPKEPKVPADAGTNRFVWNMRYPDAEDVPGNMMWRGSVTGPVAAPGSYKVELVVGGQTLAERLEIRKDPRIPATNEELQEQFDLLIKVRDKLNETHGAINQVRHVRGQVDTWVKLAAGHKDADAIAKAADELKGRLTAVEEALMQVKSKSHEDPLNFPMQLNNKLATVADVVAMDDAAPTKQSYEVFADLSAKIDGQLDQLRKVLADAVPAFTGLVRDANLPLIAVAVKQ